jgi:hypothetical protein
MGFILLLFSSGSRASSESKRGDAESFLAATDVELEMSAVVVVNPVSQGGDRDLALALNKVGDETDADNDEDDGETKAVTEECQKAVEFAVEDQVEVVGTSRADLNGVTGTITSALNVENGRIHVRLNDGSTYGTDVALKPEKLKHVGPKGDERRASRSLFMVPVVSQTALEEGLGDDHSLSHSL